MTGTNTWSAVPRGPSLLAAAQFKMAAVNSALSSSKYAVLGGGISGLTAAHHLLNKVTDPSNITLLEASPRVGGWMHSVLTEQGAVFERGPRSLRPVGEAGRSTLKLVRGPGDLR